MRSSSLLPQILLCAALAGWWTTAAAATPPLHEVPEPLPAPALDLPDLSGVPFTLAQVDGKVVLVNFWATWCPPCRKEMPALQRLSQRFEGEPFAVLGVNVGENPERIEDFLQSLPVPPGFPMLLDRSGDAAKAWNVRVVPTTWVVDRETRKVLGTVGEVDYDDPELVEQLRALIEVEPTGDGTLRTAEH
jgi:thiol-disulfide isomerase/thioredoxin